MTTLAFFDLLSPWHLLVIGLIMLLIFGRRLPEVGRNLGRGITEFKKGLKDATDTSGNDHNQQPPYQQAQYQQPYQQGGYASQPQPPQQMAPRLQPPAPVAGGQHQVRVTRQDMAD